MEWSTMASWCLKDSMVGGAMGAQVKTIQNQSVGGRGVLVGRNFSQCGNHCSVPLGSGEGAWFCLHSHLPRLVKEIHQILQHTCIYVYIYICI